MAHFLEHMIFKGTERLPPGFFDYVIESRGGMANAATSHDYAHYFITTAAGHLQDTLPYLAELLLHASIPEEEFVRERDVVLEEIHQAYDNPDWIAFQALSESIYQRHPYGRPILGTEDVLLSLTPEEMRRFHRSHYQPDNMTIVVVGDVTEAEVWDLINQNFRSFPDPLDCPHPEIEAEPPITEIRRQELRLPRLEQARLMMAWVGPGADSPGPFPDTCSPFWNGFFQEACPAAPMKGRPLRDAYGLDLLSVLLTEGRSSRLVRELREERQLVQAVGTQFSLQRDSSLFTLSAWLDPQHLERVEALICDRLSELMAAPITEAELARCKRLLCNDYAFSTETPSQLAGLYGYYHTIAHVEMATVYPDWIQSIQVEELRDLGSQYLSPYHYAATVLKPL